MYLYTINTSLLLSSHDLLYSRVVASNFCLGTEMPRHSAGSIDTYDHTAVRTSYINRIHNQQYCFVHAPA